MASNLKAEKSNISRRIRQCQLINSRSSLKEILILFLAFLSILLQFFKFIFDISSSALTCFYQLNIFRARKKQLWVSSYFIEVFDAILYDSVLVTLNVIKRLCQKDITMFTARGKRFYLRLSKLILNLSGVPPMAKIKQYIHWHLV